MNNYINLPRQMLADPIWTAEPFSKGQAWLDLILLATPFDSFLLIKRGVKVTIKRGQLAMSIKDLSERWQWSRGKVIRFLKLLEKEKMITQQKSNVVNTISICGYHTYQNKEIIETH